MEILLFVCTVLILICLIVGFSKIIKLITLTPAGVPPGQPRVQDSAAAISKISITVAGCQLDNLGALVGTKTTKLDANNNLSEATTDVSLFANPSGTGTTKVTGTVARNIRFGYKANFGNGVFTNVTPVSALPAQNLTDMNIECQDFVSTPPWTISDLKAAEITPAIRAVIRAAAVAQNGTLPDVVLIDVTVTFSIGGKPLVLTYARAIEANSVSPFNGNIKRRSVSGEGILHDLLGNTPKLS